MKKFILAVLFVFGFAVSAQALPAYDFTDTPNGVGGASNYVLGQLFTVGNDNIVVDQLGYYDHHENGFRHDHEMAIFDYSGNMLANTTVTSQDTLVNYFRYSAISDTTLYAGEQYYVAGLAHGELYNSREGIYTLDSRIASTQYTYLYQPGGLVAPTTIGYANGDYVLATNFNISDGSSQPVPEPATLLLFGTGLAGLIGYKKRQNKE